MSGPLIVAVSVAVLCCLVTVHSYGTGAPAGACEDMIPRHHADPQETQIPYVLIPSSNSVRSGGKVDFTLQGKPGSNKSFQGYLIQARANNDEIIGSWTLHTASLGAGQPLQCKGNADAITHTGKEDKTSVKLTWSPPANFKGPATIVGTVAENGGVFWVKKALAKITVA